MNFVADFKKSKRIEVFCVLPDVPQDGGEQGLLGLALHPNYSTSKRFYLNYDRLSGGLMQTVIAEYQASTDPNVADAASERILLTVNQPFANHKGGQMAFGS